MPPQAPVFRYDNDLIFGGGLSKSFSTLHERQARKHQSEQIAKTAVLG